jgi:transcriptional regulator with XRE-family HTH domain
MTRITVSPKVLRWARERAGLAIADLAGKFPHLADWEAEAAQPTMKQLESFAKATRVPFGFLFLPEPPEIPLPLPDFRTLESRRPQGASPELLDTLHLMQRRQAWLREDRMEGEAKPLSFVGAAKLSGDPAAIGREMRRIVGLNDGWAQRVPSWTAAVGELRNAIEALGVMAVINGIVGNNTRRVIRAAKEGRIGFKEAYDLSGLNGGAFQEYARKLGVSLP